MSMTFSSNGETVVVGDKSGDVLAYSLNNPEEKGSLLLGHLSMILDLTFSPDNNFVITCDRDEKIRVSHYPNAYNIESFCLGHTEFVSCLCLLPDHDQVLVSGSGDGTLRLWNYQSGDQHQVIDCSEAIGRLNDKQSTHTEPGKATAIVHFIRATKIGGAIYLAVALDGLCTILILTISASLRCECKQIIETVAPITDLQFDSTGKLWVVLMDRIRPLCVYGLDDGGKFACCESSCTAVDKEILASHLVQDLKFLTDLMTTKSRYSLLWKVKVDNVSDYIRRKQDRLNTGKQNQHIPGATPIVPSNESVSDCTTDAGKAHTDCESMNVALEKCNASIECEPEMKRLKT
ncbi:PREDICTED: tRNA (guanine-N(7)-)-methyltransferase non-catalytic subunit wdr4-like [Priapulus caudatus]|uniref:tRNA (Guanine-N(7)-)-methyltransferase non-catalytic subunit wdr4-like n=1 Tax=Priapulus caudatus TaxID=37621 RepID=A0ABM1F9N3_PRICU|nr:PREDICTED: tRNA (guanine-N(7)-)-methyltransferase non-catalytic subunit wdr4-like [Priapulus caudatus]